MVTRNLHIVPCSFSYLIHKLSHLGVYGFRVSIVFTLSLVVSSWASVYAIQHYGSTTLSSFTETPNIYSQLSEVLSILQLVILVPLYLTLIGPFALGMFLTYIGPIIVFFLWFIILYVLTYLYARFIKKNLTIEGKKYGVLSIVCVVMVCLLSVGQVYYFYEQEVSSMPQPLLLNSISPDSASSGDTITFTGSGFSKQEIDVWLFDKSSNTYGFLWSGTPSNDKAFTIPLKTSRLCDNALQDPCKDPLENFGSGQYSIEIRGGSNVPALPFMVTGTTTGVSFLATASSSTQVQATVYSQQFNLPINYFTLSTLVPMMEQNTPIQIDSALSDANFTSISGTGKQETLELVSFNQYIPTNQVLSQINSLGYRPANIDEFMSFIWNEYKSMKNVSVSTALISNNTITGAYEIPVFQWVNGVPRISLRNASEYQNAEEFTLVVLK